MALDEKGLMELKAKIDRARTKQNELKGRYTYQMQQLEQNWGCANIEAAQTQIAEWVSEKDRLGTQIQEGIAEIEEQLK